MQFNLSLLTFVAHFPASITVAALKSCKDGNFDIYKSEIKGWKAKDLAKETVKSIAMGTLFSIAIAMGTPKFHSTFTSIPIPLRNGMIVVCHLLASTAGLHLWEALGLDDSK